MHQNRITRKTILDIHFLRKIRMLHFPDTNQSRPWDRRTKNVESAADWNGEWVTLAQT